MGQFHTHMRNAASGTVDVTVRYGGDRAGNAPAGQLNEAIVGKARCNNDEYGLESFFIHSDTLH